MCTAAKDWSDRIPSDVFSTTPQSLVKNRVCCSEFELLFRCRIELREAKQHHRSNFSARTYPAMLRLANGED